MRRAGPRDCDQGPPKGEVAREVHSDEIEVVSSVRAGSGFGSIGCLAWHRLNCCTPLIVPSLFLGLYKGRWIFHPLNSAAVLEQKLLQILALSLDHWTI